MSNRSPSSDLDRDETKRAAEWAGLTAEQIRRRVRSLDNHPMRDPWGRILAGAVRRNAPHHINLLPPEWWPEDRA